MTIFAKLLNASNRFNFTLFKKYSNLVKKELEVPTFCDVYVDIPYNVKITPINIHKYHNCDKLIIEHNGTSQLLEYHVDGNHVTILGKTDDTNIECKIKIPIKANIFVNSKKDITVGQLDGDKIHLTSEEGNITLDKFHGESVKITTKRGNINLINVIQASTIEAIITEIGSISGGKLQGYNLHLKTNEGNLAVESSYCKKSLFEVQKGNMELSNVHISCKLFLNEGHLNLRGFDGKLSTIIGKGDAHIHLYRIVKSSNINIAKGSLHLKLAEFCQENVKFLIKAKECNYSKDLKRVHKDANDCVTINSDISEEQSVNIICKEGSVIMDCVTWLDMVKEKLKK